MAGGGHAHLAVLADWIRSPIAADCCMVSPSPHSVYSGMIPGWMSGLYDARQATVSLAPLCRRTGTRFVQAEVVHLDAAEHVLHLSNGQTLPFDLLSLAVGGETNVSELAALGSRLLPVRPIGMFQEHWPAWVQHSSGKHLAVVGGGAAGVELALGAAAALRGSHRICQVHLVAGTRGVLPGHALRARRLAMTALAAAGVTIHDLHAVGAEAGLLLSDGSFLAADLVLAATASRAPDWLSRSGLVCDINGFVTVGPTLRSVSHPTVFAAGDIVSRMDLKVEHSGVHAVKAGPVLASNLRATLEGGQLRRYDPMGRRMYIIATGNRQAIMSWGSIAGAHHLAWKIKDIIDRRFVGKYNKLGGL